MARRTDGHAEKTGLERVLSWLDDEESRSAAALRAIEDEGPY